MISFLRINTIKLYSKVKIKEKISNRSLDYKTIYDQITFYRYRDSETEKIKAQNFS